MAAPEGYKALGKIGISYKGDYNPNTVYERLDAVYHNGSTYLAIKDAPDGAPRNDKINWIYLAKGYDGETVDVADSEIAFTDSETRENIVSGEKVSTVFGKIKKFFTDLTAPAFAQMITTKEDLLATKVTGYVPDAKAVADAYTELNGKLQKINGILSINPNYGEIVSENCNYYENGIYYIDVFVTIGTSVPASAQLFSINRGSGTPIISKRLDAILEGASDNYFIACISNNTFLPNTKPVNAGVYKLKMVIEE